MSLARSFLSECLLSPVEIRRPLEETAPLITAGEPPLSIDEIDAERFEPRDMAARLKAQLRDGLPAKPIDLSAD